ncbi:MULTISPECIES: LppU/SCO3897 family protein [Streptomyces]|uniref:LppU/SCO3897 family protein n=1 Tax=Streptomyces TaxID=1883 RepID=UPI001F49FB30|nr:hypothetical protein [Streptomyces sp. W1SF4]
MTLTPAQAAEGVLVSVPLPTGPQRLRIPPARNGDLVRARVGDTEVLLRIRVSGPPAPPPAAPQPAPSGKSGALGCLAALAVVAVVVSLVIANSDDDSTPTASASPTYTRYTPPTYSPPTYTPPTYRPPTYTPPTYTPPTYDPAPAPPPTTEAPPSPFDTGTCLNGQLPDSTTAQTVHGVKEVSCSASDAHYRVIQRFPGTHDMSRCDANPRTEYGFSYQYTLNGSVINEYVYCLVGIGSYSRA